MPNPCPLSTLDTEEGGQVPAAPSSYLLLAAIVALRVGQRNGRKVIGRGNRKAPLHRFRPLGGLLRLRDVRLASLTCDRLVIAALAVGKKTWVAESAFLVALHTVDRLSVGTTARLLLFGIGHRLRSQHFTTRPGKSKRKLRIGAPVACAGGLLSDASTPRSHRQKVVGNGGRRYMLSDGPRPEHGVRKEFRDRED
jgi:hypothetical protein